VNLLLIFILIPLLSFGREFVLVSVYPFFDTVKLLAQGRFFTEVLIPPEADYHLYELSTGEVLKIKKAKVVFVSGVPLGGWEEKVENVAGAKTVRLARGVKLRRHEEHDEVRHDPHLWLSPKRMLKVAVNAYEGLKKHDPAGEDIYRRNLERVLFLLRELDEEYRKGLRKCRFKVLPIVHPALGYLAEDYGLTQLSLGGGTVHGGLSPKQLILFRKRIREFGVDFIFEVYGKRSKVAEVLSREYGLKIYRFNVKIVPGEFGEDYFTIMKENLKVLRKALKCT
jgi:zinc transport system substrate-binding protein